MEKHSCRVCGRSFPCGRSLGGHMRSHALHSSYKEDEARPGSKYSLRDNPRKSRRFDDSRSFSSMISSFEMFGDEFKGEENDIFFSRGSFEEEMQSESDSEASEISMAATKQRRKRSRRIAAIACSSSPEDENGALCLMLLSRDDSSLTDSSEKTSPRFKFGSNGINKVQFFSSYSSKHELRKFEKAKISSLECAICNKSFHSYQALGGHRSSHGKRSSQKCESQIAGRSPENSQNHECSICGKVFASGQALGGHKRSHFVAANSFSSTVASGDGFSSFPVLIDIEQNASDMNSIDLNLPANNNEC